MYLSDGENSKDSLPKPREKSKKPRISAGVLYGKNCTPNRPRIDENGLIIPPIHILRKGERDDPETKRREIEDSKNENMRRLEISSEEKLVVQKETVQMKKTRLSKKLFEMIRPPLPEPTNLLVAESTRKSTFPNDEISQIKNLLKQHDMLCKTPITHTDVAQKISNLSLKIGDFLLPILLRDLEYAHITNMDVVLWKKVVYRAHEILKNRAAQGIGPTTVKIREILTEFLEKISEFYKKFLHECEEILKLNFNEIIPFSCGFPDTSLNFCIEDRRKRSDLSQIVVGAIQMIFMALADISRYRLSIAALDNYREALRYYATAALLCPEQGRAYSQIAFFAVNSNKYLDIFFFYIRALAATEPFESVKEPLHLEFNNMANRCMKCDMQVSVIFDKLTETRHRSDRPNELWYLPVVIESFGIWKDEDMCSGIEMLLREPVDKLYKRMVVYLIHTAGILITKISTETVELIAERGLCHLGALLKKESPTPLTALELVKFSAIFIFAIHNSIERSKKAEQQTQWTLSESFRVLLTFFGTLLSNLKEKLKFLPKILTFEGKTDNFVTLPAIYLLSRWLAEESMRNVYINLPLECHSSMSFAVDCWKNLAEIANRLTDYKKQQLLSQVDVGTIRQQHERFGFNLPENAFLESFCGIFTTEPIDFYIDLNSTKKKFDNNNLSLIAVHIRLAALLHSAKKLAKMGLPCFKWDLKKERFERPNEIFVEPSEVKKDSVAHEKGDLEIMAKGQETEELFNQKEFEKIVLEVHPKYFVIDTNTYIDHLEKIEKILASKYDFYVVTPTVVITELAYQAKKDRNLPQIFANLPVEKEDWLGHKAAEAIAFLKKHREDRKFFTVTVRGEALPRFHFVQEDLSKKKMSDTGAKGHINDDYILAACENMSKKFAQKPVSKNNDANSNKKFIAKSVVLITEDRELTGKALASKVPVSTLPKFIEWAGL